MKKSLLSVLIIILAFIPVHALEDGVYSITCAASTNGYAALGAYHKSQKGLLFISDSPIASDGYWQVTKDKKSDVYTIQNVVSKEYLSYCTTYSDTCKYLTRVISVSSDNQRWYLNAEGTGYRIQNVGNNSYYFNLRTSSGLLGCYASKGNNPGLFYFTPKEESGEGGGGEEKPEEKGALETEAMTAPMLFIHFIGGNLIAFPKSYISTYEKPTPDSLSIFTSWGDTVTYASVSFVSETMPVLPYFTSYKFNNKFNSQLYTDAIGIDDTTENPATLTNISVTVAGIGKWLTASFQMNDAGALAYVDSILQKSKKTRQSFSKPVKYLLTYPYYRLVGRRTVGKSYELGYAHYGKEVTVTANFLTDAATSSVPAIYINTDDGQAITSKEYYKGATIRIDGGGVFADMDEMPMQIKGRGNTSWAWEKKPYHFKFSSKQKPLGMKSGKHWVLLSNHLVNSLMTNALGMKICNITGTAACNHIIPVDLYLNDEYRGSYNLTEKVGFSNNSVEPADESVAAMLEMDTYTDEDYFYLNNYDIICKYHEPDFTEEGTVITQQMIQDDFNRVADAIYDEREDYVNLVDVDAMCRFFLANEIILNRELKWPKSVFLYSEDVTNNPENYDGSFEVDETPWVFGPVWDLDWAWGYETNHRLYYDNADMDFFSNLHKAGTSLKPEAFFRGLRYGSEVVKKAYDKVWKEFMPLKQELIDYVDEYYAYAQPSFARNYDKWYNGDRDYAENVKREKSWLTTRINTIYNNHVEHYPDDPEPELPLYGDANGDGFITVSDVTMISAQILNQHPAEIDLNLADANQDGSITIMDIITVVNIICSNDAAQRNVPRRATMQASDSRLHLAPATIPDNEPGTMTLSVDLEGGAYRGIQFDVSLPQGLTLQGIQSTTSGLDITCREIRPNVYRAVIYQSQYKDFALGTLELQLTLWSDDSELSENNCVNVHHALLSTNDFVDERLNAASATCTTGNLTAINNPEANGQQPTANAIYDLLGRPVHNPIRGHLYIINGQKRILP